MNVSSHPLNEKEWQTRKQRIDTQLKAMNPAWNIIPHHDGMDTSQLHRCAVEEYPTKTGPADYALFIHGQFVGVIEAKKVSVNAANVLEQAKRYSRGATDGIGQWGEYRVPLLYASNGNEVYFIDVRQPQSYSRTLSNFHTPDAIEEMLEREDGFAWFEKNPNQVAGLWRHQEVAIAAVEDAISKGRRNHLVAMATGTGKTFTTVAQVHRMLESKAIRRVLFLVDRRALAAQAVQAFHSFDTPNGRKFTQEYSLFHQQFRREDLEETDTPFDPQVLPDKYLTAPDGTHTFVYVCTIQRMAINLFGHSAVFEDESGGFGEGEGEGDATKLDIPIHAFDVIIADECHRGYTGQQVGLWQRTIQHFDAIRIGLTATPAAHTVELFGTPVYRYGTGEAISEGHLVDYEAVKISSGVRMNGVFLKEGELVKLRNLKDGTEQTDYLEDQRAFDSQTIERQITVPDSNRKIIRELAAYAAVHEQQYGRFPKMLIFAANDLPNASHADQLVDLCRKEFGQGDEFVQKITGNANVDRPLQRIREFRNRPIPKVVVTVDMLSTGVDIPSLEFIVFLRPVKSRILWVQMLGRGTRCCNAINKSHFTVFDCFDGTLIEYFKGSTDFDVEVRNGKPTLPISKVIENIYNNFEREYSTKILVRRLHRIDKEMSGEARQAFADFGIPDGNLGKWATELPDKLKSNWTATMALLRDEKFQEVLQDYGKAKSFWIAPGQVDTVSSQTVFHVGEKHLQPADYLQEFGRWVRENPEHIEAIQILKSSPKSWSREALEGLRGTLRRHSFGEETLKRARKLVGLPELADIISQVKHAANEQEPLLTAQERVDRAIEKVTTGRTFDANQSTWLGRIREHLVENLSLNMNDFGVFPIFTDAGGQGRAKKVFTEPVLIELVEEFNEALAA